jgi:hypothetical protein
VERYRTVERGVSTFAVPGPGLSVVEAAAFWHKVRMRDQYTLLSSINPIETPLKSDDYRKLAAHIREVARQTRLTVARNELLRRATNYARRAELIDRRSPYW